MKTLGLVEIVLSIVPFRSLRGRRFAPLLPLWPQPPWLLCSATYGDGFGCSINKKSEGVHGSPAGAVGLTAGTIIRLPIVRAHDWPRLNSRVTRGHLELAPRKRLLSVGRSVQAHGSKGCRFPDPAVTP